MYVYNIFLGWSPDPEFCSGPKEATIQLLGEGGLWFFLTWQIIYFTSCTRNFIYSALCLKQNSPKASQIEVVFNDAERGKQNFEGH